MTRNTTLKLFLAAFVALLTFSCGPVDPKEKQPATLVYILVDNDLARFAITNINELEGGLTGKESGKIFVFIDAKYGDIQVPTLLEILPDKDFGKIRSKIIKEYEPLNSCDPKVFDRVMTDIGTRYDNVKIENVIMSSHGKSWVPVNSSLYKSPKERSFGADDSHNSEMDIKEMAQHLQPYGFRVLMFDACFMAGVEFFYQLRNCADYLVGSPAEVLAEGFPYRALAPYLAAKNIDPGKVVDLFFEHYKNSSGTICYVKTDQLEALAAETKKILTDQYRNIPNQLVVNKTTSYARYASNMVYDYKMYMDVVVQSYYQKATDLESLWQKAVPKYLKTASMLGMIDLSKTKGLTFYAPLSTVPDNYNNYFKTLDWAKDSGFNLFLN